MRKFYLDMDFRGQKTVKVLGFRYSTSSVKTLPKPLLTKGQSNKRFAALLKQQ